VVDESGLIQDAKKGEAFASPSFYGVTVGNSAQKMMNPATIIAMATVTQTAFFVMLRSFGLFRPNRKGTVSASQSGSTSLGE
jgi:hypothetical protein